MGLFIIVALIIFALPNIWIYFEMIRLFSNRTVKITATLLFLFLVCAFPVGEILVNFNPQSVFASSYLMLGYFYLPFLLYFLLLLVAFKLLLLITRVSGTISGEIQKTRKFRAFGLMILFVISTGIVIYGHYNFNHTRITSYEIEVPAGSSGMDMLKIAVASDVHIYELTSHPFMEQLVSKINGLEADVVLLAGDILEGARENPEMAYYEAKLTELEATYGVFAAPGNHEHYGIPLSEVHFFEDAGIALLDDSAVLVNESVNIIGISDESRDSAHLVPLLNAFLNDTLPDIVIHHRPMNYGLIGAAGADMVVSGHTHHGQLWPFHLITKSVYPLSWGHAVFNNLHAFVSCGAQGWGPQVRTGSYSEVMEIVVRFADER